MERTLIVKEKGITKEITGNLKVEKLPGYKKGYNPCTTCVNCKPELCSKEKDKKKKNLAEYDYITDAVQEFAKDGSSKVFEVKGCSNYVKRDKVTYVKVNGVVTEIKGEYKNPQPCAKVFDIEKQNIGEYDFITDGVQTYDEKGELDSFIVNGCENYVKDERNSQRTKEEKERLQRARLGIMLYYFNAENIEEASQTQEDLYRRGHITR